ncbi:MAG: LysR family transcriptional regulator [Anaerovoracaceae bacterium]|jgi:DNA-binding transcriptional LysR family regulator
MDLEKITYFFSAAELGNFTRAARKCGITQTAMSKYIASLEDELGCTLFSRTNKGCTLTREGQLFYDGMKKIHGDYLRLKDNVDMSGEKTLWIGIEGDILSVPELIEFERENPHTGIAVTFGRKEKLLSDLRAGKCDALMLFDTLTGMQVSYDESGLGVIRLPGQVEKFVCSKQALEKYGSPENIIRELPMVTRSDSEAYYQYCREGLTARFGTSFSRVIHIDSISKQKMIVSLSRGFAIVPSFEVGPGDDLVSFPMHESYITAMQFVYDKSRVSPELSQLADFLKKAMAQ